MNINPQISPIVAFLIVIIIALFSVVLIESYYALVVKDIDTVVELLQTI